MRGLGELPQVEGIIAMHPEAVAIDDDSVEVITIDQASGFDPMRAVGVESAGKGRMGHEERLVLGGEAADLVESQERGAD